eukprot:4574784-Karenia_brevis.AAC.1
MPYCNMKCLSKHNVNELLKAYHKASPVGSPWETQTKDNEDKNMSARLLMANAEPEGQEHRKRIMKCVF